MLPKQETRIARRLRARGRPWLSGDVRAFTVNRLGTLPRANLMRSVAAQCMTGDGLEALDRKRRAEALRALRVAFATESVFP